jgi:hypothetical protein
MIWNEGSFERSKLDCLCILMNILQRLSITIQMISMSILTMSHFRIVAIAKLAHLFSELGPGSCGVVGIAGCGNIVPDFGYIRNRKKIAMLRRTRQSQ